MPLLAVYRVATVLHVVKSADGERRASLPAHQPFPNPRRERDQEADQEHSKKEELHDQPGRAVRGSAAEAESQEQRDSEQNKPETAERPESTKGGAEAPHLPGFYVVPGQSRGIGRGIRDSPGDA